MKIVRFDHGLKDGDFAFQEAVVGRASATTIESKFSLEDNDIHVDFLEKYILRHEIRTCFGLGHPRGEGAHPDFTVEDTIMSYNVFRFFPNGISEYYGLHL